MKWKDSGFVLSIIENEIAISPWEFINKIHLSEYFAS
jgi:hypothetical protein